MICRCDVNYLLVANTTQRWIVSENEVAHMKDVPLELGIICRKEKPVTYFAAEALNRSKRRQSFAKYYVKRIGAFRRDKPDTIV